MHQISLDTPDILLVKDGVTTGKSIFIDETFPYAKACVNEHVFIIRLNNSLISRKYVFHYLHSVDGKNKILKKYSWDNRRNKFAIHFTCRNSRLHKGYSE
jgi:hypothetical protein